MSLTSRKIPRAPDPNGAFVVNGAAWNAMADAVEKISHLAISPPLTLVDTGNNVCIGITPQVPGVVPVLITGSATLGGAYYGSNLTGIPNTVSGTSSGFWAADFGMTSPTNRLLILNPLESTSSNHAINVPTGGFPGCAFLLGRNSTDNPPLPMAVLLEGYLPPMVFWVKTSQSGGSDGGSNTAATYTYNVTNQASLVGLGFAPSGTMAVTMQRPNGSVHAASNGIMFLAGTNQKLIWVDEAPNTAGCT